jgi:hypothetical protein
MKKVTTTVFIPKQILTCLNKWLSGNRAVESSGHNEILYKVFVEFSDNIEADIKVVNCEGGPYVDAVLFENNNEVMCLEPSYEQLHGEYIFEFNNVQYIAILKCES